MICYCNSAEEFSNCCKPIIEGKKIAETAEMLMRSRYSAYANNNIQYILDTYAEETRPADDINELSEASKTTEWKELEVLNSTKGSKDDKTGTVEFKAHFIEGNSKQVMHELSRFVKRDNQWLYIDGSFPTHTPAITNKVVGRNEPCHCGSGKKFKKCCM